MLKFKKLSKNRNLSKIIIRQIKSSFSNTNNKIAFNHL